MGPYVERHSLAGALQEAKLYTRALDSSEIAGIAESHAKLIGWKEPVNDALQFVVSPYLQAAAVHDRTIQFKACDIEGRLFDTFELTRPAGR